MTQSLPREDCLRNAHRLVPALVCACALASGCGVQMFLRVDRVQLDERLVFFLGGGGNSFVYLHDGVAFLADPKFGPGAKRFHAEVETELRRKVERVLLTHSHFDHAGGLGLYDPAVVLVHPRARARLEAQGVRTRPGAWVEVEHEIQLTLGGERVRVMYLGPGHTDGDLVALFEARRLLVAGDLALDGWEPVIDARAGGSLLALRATLERVLELDFERVLPGHGEPMTRAKVQRLHDYLVALENAVREARKRGLDEDAVAREVGPKLGFDELQPVPFSANREKNVRSMYREAGESR